MRNLKHFHLLDKDLGLTDHPQLLVQRPDLVLGFLDHFSNNSKLLVIYSYFGV